MAGFKLHEFWQFNSSHPPNLQHYLSTLMVVYPEVNRSISVLIEYPVDVVHEYRCVTSGDDHGVHFQNLVFIELTIRTVGLEYPEHAACQSSE